MAKKIKNHSKKLAAIFLIFSIAAFVGLYKFSQAASLTSLSDTMTRLKDSSGATVYSNHDIRFRSPTGMSSGTITMTLGTGAGFVKQSG